MLRFQLSNLVSSLQYLLTDSLSLNAFILNTFYSVCFALDVTHKVVVDRPKRSQLDIFALMFDPIYPLAGQIEYGVDVHPVAFLIVFERLLPSHSVERAQNSSLVVRLEIVPFVGYHVL